VAGWDAVVYLRILKFGETVLMWVHAYLQSGFTHKLLQIPDTLEACPDVPFLYCRNGGVCILDCLGIHCRAAHEHRRGTC
jgi:hypothetical protein